MSDPTASSTIPTPVPPTPNPSTGAGTPSPPTQPTSNPTTTSLPTPQGPILSEQQMMGCHVLVIMGFKASTIKKLKSEDLDEFSNLLMVSEETLEEIKTKGLITGVNRDAILKFQAWHMKYLSYQNPPLKTKAELSTVFDTDVLNDFMSQSSNASQTTQNVPNAISTTAINPANTSGSSTSKPSDLSKFLSWNGRKDTWDTFHTKLKAILSMNKLRRLLENDKKIKSIQSSSTTFLPIAQSTA